MPCRCELPGRNGLARISDRDLAARYWAARGELDRLRTRQDAFVRETLSGEELAGAFLRIRELDALCAQLWQESRRRTLAGSIEGDN
jgi:hypothetical protein